MKCSHKSITSGREIIFRCQFHTDAVENNFLRLEKSQLDEACKGSCNSNTQPGNAKVDGDGCCDGSNHQDCGSVVLAMVMLVIGTLRFTTR